MIGATPAVRRYTRRVLGLSIGYTALLFGAVWLFRHHPLAGLPGMLVASLPALAVVGIFAAIGRYLVEETDEYLRALASRQALIATGFSLSITTVYGFIEDAGLAPHVPAFYVAVLWFAGFGVGACINPLFERRAA
ncbi:hypothetical protein [Sphingomonas bacterium]|uniref:hypothetical protein n=1 Tax=Sphingomonas bacterium TaxID=1895847 RepID=UPI0015759A9F|nr:hypothetical protein [Sphingomonas bacterium]